MTLPYEIVILDVGGEELVYPWMRAGQADPEQVGGISRAYAGNQYTSITAEFDVIPLLSEHRTSDEYAAVKTMFAKGAQIPCQGGAAGNVFEPRTDIITCSGKVTGEMEPGMVGDDGKPLWTINLTLTEVDNDDTAVSTPTTLYLTNVASGDPGVNTIGASAADDPFSAGIGSVELVNGITVPTCAGPAACAIVISPAAEMTWRLPPAVADGYITGAPRVAVHSMGGTGDIWATQSVMFKIFVERGGVDVVEWDTAWSSDNGGFSGGDITCTAPAVIFPGLTGDEIRVEAYGRASLQPGATDNGNHQTISYGNVGADSHWGRLILGGDVALMWPA